MKEILINIDHSETRIAILKAGKLKEIHVERTNHQNIIGNIYKGKVKRIALGMQSAFLDINIERSAFLHITDLFAYTQQREKKNISDFLKEGQEVIVQVYKDALGTKGARLTTHIGIPSRYLVFTPNDLIINVSQKITDPAERERLKTLLAVDSAGGYIVRTAAVSASDEDILADQTFLKETWEKICLRAKESKASEIIYEELPIELRIVRDLSVSHVEKIRVDNPKAVEKIQAFSEQCMPSLYSKIEYYDSSLPIFDLYSIDDQINQLLERKVYLKSGGYIIIDQTEALTTIDVNTGSFLGRNNKDETIYQTNVEAVKIIASQIRLRNLGGIIIIDLIDMHHPEHRQKLLKLFEEEVAKDPARVELHELTTLGLLQITRKRIRESLEHILCDTCPACGKKGFIKSVATVCYDIFREIRRLDTIYTWKAYLVKTSQEVLAYLENEEADQKADLEVKLGKPISIKADVQYKREQFDILPWENKEKPL